MMIRDCKHLIELRHIHTEQMHLKCAKVKRWQWKTYFFVENYANCPFYEKTILKQRLKNQ